LGAGAIKTRFRGQPGRGCVFFEQNQVPGRAAGPSGNGGGPLGILGGGTDFPYGPDGGTKRPKGGVFGTLWGPVFRFSFQPPPSPPPPWGNWAKLGGGGGPGSKGPRGGGGEKTPSANQNHPFWGAPFGRGNHGSTPCLKTGGGGGAGGLFNLFWGNRGGGGGGGGAKKNKKPVWPPFGFGFSPQPNSGPKQKPGKALRGRGPGTKKGFQTKGGARAPKSTKNPLDPPLVGPFRGRGAGKKKKHPQKKNGPPSWGPKLLGGAGIKKRAG